MTAKKHKLLNENHTGLLLPLFSMNSSKDFGIGDISSLNEWLDVLKELNFDVLQILPINEMPPMTNCPYTSMTAFAIDPIYISIEEIENLSPRIKEKLSDQNFIEQIKKIKEKNYIDYDEIKKIKFSLLWEQYEYFLKSFNEKTKEKFKEYIRKNSYWLEDYAIFRRLKDIKGWTTWTMWEDEIKNRDKHFIENFKFRNSKEIDFFKYIQWELEKQWQKAKEKARKYNIKFFGDLPFMVNQESADIWSRQKDFRLDLEVGAPPDAFSQTGQKWGLPAYNWQEQEKNCFEWWRLKLQKFSDYYDIYRIDHMVGFFRTWVIPKSTDLKPHFDISDPQQQEERGRKFLQTMIESSNLLPIAEDLGVIPDYVRKVLKELNVCGYKVLRWEKEKSGYYKDPEKFEPISLTTTSTHDNEPMALWWEQVDKIERKFFWKMISGGEKVPATFLKARDKIIEKVTKSNSCFVIFPFQDIVSSKERINEPNTVGIHNWTYRVKFTAKEFLNNNSKLVKFISGIVKQRNGQK